MGEQKLVVKVRLTSPAGDAPALQSTIRRGELQIEIALIR
jgi:hypothetical protein